MARRNAKGQFIAGSGKTSTVNIGAYKARFNGRLGAFKRAVLLKLFGAVIKDTPVVTGRLRGNWTFEKSVTNTDLSRQTTDTSGGPTLGRIASDIQANVDEEDGVYCLSNSMPYTNRIEYDGWSHTKAPEGMVRKNLVRIARILKEQSKR